MCLTSEKRTEMALARRNLEGNGGIACDNARTRSTTKLRKSPGPNYYTNNASRIDSPSAALSTSPPRAYAYSPTTESVAKQYAGCKWTEPPSPSTLPQPPKHWTQSQPFFAMPFQTFCQPEQPDIAQQLKVLLKVQA